MSRRELRKVADRIADEEVARMANIKFKSGSQGIVFFDRDYRTLKSKVKQRLKAETKCGFISLQWFLLMVLGEVIRWAVRRWLDKRSNNQESADAQK